MNLNKMRRAAMHHSRPHASLSPGRQPAVPREVPSNEYLRHRRMASLNFKPRATLRALQNVQSPNNNNNALFQKYCRGARTEKPTPLLSPRMSTMKSLILTEIYTSKPLCKSISHHPTKLGNTTVIKSGRLIEEVRHGSTGNHRRMQTQKVLCPGSTRARRSKEAVVTPKRRSVDEVRMWLAEGVEGLRNRNFSHAIDRFNKVIALCPSIPDPYFNRGITFLESNMTAKALKDFQKVAEEWPRYNKSVYLYLSMTYAKIPDTSSAISSLNKAISLYHDFTEAYLARGQLLYEKQKYTQALHDFAMVQSLSPTLALGYIGAGDCFEVLGNTEKAINSYTEAAELDPDSKPKVLFKRGRLYYKKRDLELALKDVSEYIEKVESTNVEALLMLGKIQRKKGTISDALINFEQVIKYDKEGVLAINAIIKMAKIKLKQKDFYGAHHTLQRPSVLNITPPDSRKLDNYSMLTEAVLYLIKRKAKVAVKMLTTLLKSESLSKYIRAQCHIYRGYAHMALHDFNDALGDYTKAMMYKHLGKSSRFNMLVCECVRAIDQNDYDTAIKHIDRALELFPHNKETRFYRITIQVAKFQECNDPNLAREINKRLDVFIKEKKNEHMLYYFRGVLELYKQEFMNGLKDFEKAIDYCDNVVAKYYLGRARCYACLSMFKEAISDLNTAIEANDSLLEAYILRGKCAFISGDTKQAFMDFQRVIKLKPEDPMMHIHAANILMASGAYEQAVKAYTNAHKLGKIPMALFGRAKCYVALCNIPKALMDVSSVVKSGCDKFKNDLSMLKILSSLSQIKEAEESTKPWEQAINELNKLIGLSNVKSKEVMDDMQSQLLEDIELANTSIFAQEDFVLYRAVAKFYLKQYSAALTVFLIDFQDAYSLMAANKSYIKENSEEDPNSSIDSDLSDVGLCTLNKYEYQYNSLLCWMLTGEYEKACSLATNILENANPEYVSKMWLLRGILHSLLGKTTEAEADLEIAKRDDPIPAKAFFSKKDQVKFEVFSEQNRLCACFPYLKFATNKLPTIVFFEGMVRPSFSMPFVKPPGIIPYVDKSILSEFTYKAINCRPEAPWIKRCEHGIKFTDEIRSTIDSVESEVDQVGDQKPVYVEQEQYEKMKEEYDNVKIKARSHHPVAPTLSFAINAEGDDS